MNRVSFVPLVLASVLLAAGCSPEIGDECSSNSDCSGSAICDTSQAGGYCTQTPCRPGECPAEATCIEFEPEVTYCMKTCIDYKECRYGQTCVKGLLDPAGKAYPGFCNQVGEPTGETETP
jgi:hypothetical protein